MKTKILFLFALFIRALWAQPIITEVRDLAPPVDWKRSALSNEPWWPALMAELQPEKLSYQEWKKFYSDTFIGKSGITEASFSQRWKDVAKKRDEMHPISELARLLFIKDGDDNFVRVEEIVARLEETHGSDTRRITFLKKQGDGWIVWTTPADMPFGAPLQRVKVKKAK